MVMNNLKLNSIRYYPK